MTRAWLGPGVSERDAALHNGGRPIFPLSVFVSPQPYSPLSRRLRQCRPEISHFRRFAGDRTPPAHSLSIAKAAAQPAK